MELVTFEIIFLQIIRTIGKDLTCVHVNSSWFHKREMKFKQSTTAQLLQCMQLLNILKLVVIRGMAANNFSMKNFDYPSPDQIKL